jgi:hypothetical protein
MPRLAALLEDADWLTPVRIRCAAAIMLALGLALFAADLWLHTRHGVLDAKGEQLGRDFVNYWAGARAAAGGHAAMAYRPQAFDAFQKALTGPDAQPKLYSYPPPAMLLALPLAAAPYLPAFLLWTVAGAVVAASLLASRFGWGWALVAAMAAPAFQFDAAVGQNGAFSAGLLAGGVLLLPKRPILAGVLFGLLCYKPQLGLMIPVALLAGRCWRALFAAAATVLIAVAASTALFGVDAWLGFLHGLPLHRALLEQDRLMWRYVPTVFVAVRWLGGASGLAYAVQALSALAAAAVVFAVWRGEAAMRLKGVTLLVAVFLATPYAWGYDLVMLTPAACWYWEEAEAEGWRPWERLALAAMIAAPALAAPMVTRTHLHLGPVVLWWTLALAARRALPPNRAPQPEPALVKLA